MGRGLFKKLGKHCLIALALVMASYYKINSPLAAQSAPESSLNSNLCADLLIPNDYTIFDFKTFVKLLAEDEFTINKTIVIIEALANKNMRMSTEEIETLRNLIDSLRPTDEEILYFSHLGQNIEAAIEVQVSLIKIMLNQWVRSD